MIWHKMDWWCQSSCANDFLTVRKRNHAVTVPKLGSLYFADPAPRQHSFLVSYYGEGQSRPSAACPGKSDPGVSQCDSRFGCKCLDATNNTYGCVRTHSEAEDTLYCAFSDGFAEMYNLEEDKHQLFNLASLIDQQTRSFYEGKVAVLSNCTGSQQCFHP